MICNIRRLSTWEHLASLTALDWELPLWAEDDEQGRVTIFGEQPDYSGQWACINGGLFFISGSAPEADAPAPAVRLFPRASLQRDWLGDIRRVYRRDHHRGVHRAGGRGIRDAIPFRFQHG